MKIFQSIVVAAFALVSGLVLHAQGSEVPVLELDAPNVDQLWAKAEWHEANTGKDLNGEMLTTDWDFFEHAVKEKLAGGATRFSLAVRVAEAPALCVYFSEFHLPTGARLFFETPIGAFDFPFVEGPVDASENNAHGRWVSGEIPGETTIIRYEEPSGLIGQPALQINALGYFFRGLWLPEEFTSSAADSRGGSEPCEVDVRCPEGEAWACQRDAVVRLRISMGGSIYFCSGAMVNNTALDCRQLMLSSFHCADDMDADDWPYLKVRYNFEMLECGGMASINSHDRTGVEFLTASFDSNGSNINGSDFLLVEVEDEILESWNPFFAGWDASSSPAQSGVGIHHPAGDRKKISTYASNVTSSSAYAPSAHWKVNWVETETNHGVTEGGSSGSPLFNEVKRVVGTLTGGSSYCDSPNAPDYYGKMSYHWDGNNPIDDDEKLHNFLDPGANGVESMDGSYRGEGDSPCLGNTTCTPLAIEEELLANGWNWNVMPNPATTDFSVVLPEGVSFLELRLYDATGRFIARSGEKRMNVSNFETGVYFVTIETLEGATATRQLHVR
jgi:hypothetical protein